MNIFCHICGAKNEEGSRFCCNCGELLDTTFIEKGSSKSEDDSGECYCRGVIFTNLSTLSEKLNTTKSLVKSFIEQYIQALEESSVYYTLIDASEYSYINPEANKRSRNVSLLSDDGWVMHSYLLADYYKFGIQTQEESLSYLFIIGGDDIIPMPHITRRDSAIEELDSDLPYAYLLGEKTYHLSDNLEELFAYTPFFQVGRLPLAADSTIEDLHGYLSRSASVASSGIQIKKAFGQSDIHWREVSHMVAGEITHLLPRFDANSETAHLSYKGLATTPYVVSEQEKIQGGINVSKVLDRSVNLVYFNLHGSDGPQSGDFVGEVPNANPKCYLSAITPEHMTLLQQDNIVVTEACYGGKFMSRSASSKTSYDYEKRYAMLLSSIFHNTLLFLGSSRIAFGIPRADGLEQLPHGFGADIICKNFIDAIVNNCCAGDALFLARRAILTDQYRDISDPSCSIASVLEFNLFGDPTLFAYVDSNTKDTDCNRKTITKNGVIPPLIENNENKSYKKTTLYSTKEKTILQQVRSLVDKNIEEIRESINEYIYSSYGVEARDMARIDKIEYQSKEINYCFTYKKSDEIFVVTSSITGDIKSVITSK